MKLDGCKLLHEDEREFHVEHPEHGTLRIAKEHLHHGTVQKIKQHFADGGVVKPQVKVPEKQPYMAEYDPRTNINPDSTKKVLSGVRNFVAPGYADGGEVPPEYDWSTGAPTTPLSDEQRAQLARDFPGGALRGFGLEESATPAPIPVAAAQPPPAAPVSPPPPPQAAPAIPQGTPLPGAGREFEAGHKQQLSGIQAESEAAQAQAKQESAAYETRQHGLQKMQADLEGQMTAHTARIEKLQSDILNGHVDPNRFWNTRSTGQKITAALGMILGGAGAGVTGQPNYAIQAIDKAIDRDLEAQRLDLGKKETLLGYYMQQGHQMMAAHQLAKADYMDITAAQLMKAASQGGGQKAAAVAQQLAGAAKMGADKMRREATLQGLQITQTKMATDFQRAQLGAMSQLMGGSSNGGTNLDPRAEMLLPEEMRGRLVRLGDGTAALARTPKDAEEVKKTQETTGILRDKLQRYGALLAAHPHGVSEVASNTDYNSAKGLYDSIVTDINSLAGLSRFTPEEHKVFVGRLPDITSKQLMKGHQAKLKELGKEMDDKVWNVNKTYLITPQKRRPAG